MIQEAFPSMSDQFEMKTKGGYDLKLVRSSIQKMIRRGQEVESLYWAQEFVEGGYTAYLFRTLSVILAEDVGWADPAVMGAVSSLLTYMQITLKEKKEYEVGPGVSAIVIMMCRARKSRCADNAWQYVLEKKKAGLKLEVPSVAMDEHNDHGRRLGRYWRFWVSQGSKLHPQASIEEIGGTDYSEMEEFWMKGKPTQQDEPWWNEWSPLNPDEPIRQMSKFEYEERYKKGNEHEETG